jgi:hypothetical protein
VVKGLLQYTKDYGNRHATLHDSLVTYGRKLYMDNIDGKFYLMIWTITIVVEKQFLCINEVLATNVTASNIVALVDSVCGKSNPDGDFLRALGISAGALDALG